MRNQEAARATGPGCDAPEGSQDVTGVIVRAKEREGFRGRTEVKLTVRDDRGFEVWVTRTTTVARALGTDLDTYPGARIAFTADLNRSDRSPAFAFARCPSQVTATPAPPRPTRQPAPIPAEPAA